MYGSAKNDPHPPAEGVSLLGRKQPAGPKTVGAGEQGVLVAIGNSVRPAAPDKVADAAGHAAVGNGGHVKERSKEETSSRPLNSHQLPPVFSSKSWQLGSRLVNTLAGDDHLRAKGLRRADVV